MYYSLYIRHFVYTNEHIFRRGGVVDKYTTYYIEKPAYMSDIFVVHKTYAHTPCMDIKMRDLNMNVEYRFRCFNIVIIGKKAMGFAKLKIR